MGQVERGLQRGPAVAAVTAFTVAGDGGNHAVTRDFPNALTVVFTKPQRAVGTPHQAKRIVKLRRDCGAAVAAEAGLTGAGKRCDCPVGRHRWTRNQCQTEKTAQPGKRKHGEACATALTTASRREANYAGSRHEVRRRPPTDGTRSCIERIL